MPGNHSDLEKRLCCVFNSAWGRDTVAGSLVGVAQQHFNIGVAAGAAVPTLNRNDIHGLATVLPRKNILDKFDGYVLALFALKRNLERKNANLRTTRDLLLPKLISGQVSVDGAEKMATMG
jgi:hypothetical protein